VVAANSYTYDALNRLSTVSASNTGLTSYGYDNVGNLQSVTYPNGVVHNYTYDNRNRLTNLGVNGKVGGASGVIASYAYTLDAAGHRTAVAELSWRTVNYGYDTIYRLTSETIASDPSSCGTAIPGCAGGITGAVSYAYDAVGNLTSKTDRRGQYIAYTYDQLNRLTLKTYPDNSTVNYTYDNDSRLTQVTDPTGAYSFTFDNMGRLTNTSTQYAFLTGRSFTTSYGYDAASNRTGFTDPENGSTSYLYDT
jgi:YD repeat-containing protein